MKHVLETKPQALTKAETNDDVTASPYPREGTLSDLTASEAALYEEADKRSMALFAGRVDFKSFVLVLDAAGLVRPMKQQSWKKSKEALASHVTSGDSSGFVRSQLVVSGLSGVLIHDIETCGRPQVSVRTLVKNYVCDKVHVHLLAPSVLHERAPDLSSR